MSEFCLACARENGDPTDLAGLGARADVVCEGCGSIVVDNDGRCLSAGCLMAGRPGHGGMPINVVRIERARKKNAAPSTLFDAPAPREREQWAPRTVAIAVAGFHDMRGPVGACLVVRAGDRVGETPVRGLTEGRKYARQWLESYEASYPNARRDDIVKTYVDDGPEYHRALEVAERELSRAIAMIFARRTTT
jgi:hypothetical protein